MLTYITFPITFIERRILHSLVLRNCCLTNAPGDPAYRFSHIERDGDIQHVDNARHTNNGGIGNPFKSKNLQKAGFIYTFENSGTLGVRATTMCCRTTATTHHYIPSFQQCDEPESVIAEKQTYIYTIANLGTYSVRQHYGFLNAGLGGFP